jgi:inosine/xanthosine triphosphatase
MPLLALTRVAVGSRNPVKVGAVRTVLATVAPEAEVVGVEVSSGVADQPWGDEETIRGARARAVAARLALDADLGVGIEGGVVEMPWGLRCCAWAVVADRGGVIGTGGSLAMPLPPAVAARIRDGAELGEAMDALTGRRETKTREGAVGILTAGLIDRQRAYEMLVTYALAPLLSPGYWGDAGPRPAG